MLLRLLFDRYAAPLLLILAFSAFCAAANERASTVESPLELSDPFGSVTLGDLDGDHETDLALSREVGQSDSGYVYRVELKLSETHQPVSFTFSNTDGLGVNIAAVDVDGDHDLDLVISGRFTGQRIGLWINDGRGVFTRNLNSLYSVPEDRVLHSLRLDIPNQAIGENSSRRLLSSLLHAPFVPAVLFPNRVERGVVVHCKFRFQNGPQYLRSPPTPSSVAVLIWNV
jgi:hypothetical protein